MTIGSLFSGIGGLELGLEMCGLGPVAWQAERDPYARAVLARHWPEVKRYEDVKEIDGNAPPVDLICGGFPCQDISVAGRGAGLAGERSGLWFEFARIIRVVRPRIVFVENVSALASRGLDRVLGDLAALGFDAEWSCFRASDVGAPHRRERLFILANADRDGLRVVEQWLPGGRPRRVCDEGEAIPVHDGAPLADANGPGRGSEEGRSVRGVGAAAIGFGTAQLGRRGGGSVDMADADGGGCEVVGLAQPGGIEGARGRVADGRGDEWHQHRFPPGPSEIAGYDGPQPAIRRGDARLSNRVDRLRCLGNSVVPQVAALAFAELARRACA